MFTQECDMQDAVGLCRDRLRPNPNLQGPVSTAKGSFGFNAEGVLPNHKF